MSMFNDIIWEKKENEKVCEENSIKVGIYATRFLRGHWSFSWTSFTKEVVRHL